MWANDEVARPGILRILAWCALVFLASRGLLEVIGVGARLLGYPVMDPQYLPIAYSPQAWMDIWAVWDSGWFIDIVERGYDTSVRTDPRNEGQANWAFFPLYPMIAKALVMLTGMTSVAALIIIANIAFFATLPLIWYETAHWYGDRAADMAVALLAFLPGSFIFSSAYSESLFLLFVVVTLAFARREAWLLAGIAAALATLTRNLGILLIVPILMHALQAHGGWRDRNVVWRRRLEVLAAIALPLLALAGFMVFLRAHTGDALAFATVQDAWKRELQNPIVTLIGPLLPNVSVQTEIVPSIAMAWISVFALFLLLARRNWPHAIYMLAIIGITLASGILSYFRFFLTMAPAVMVLGAFLAGRPRSGAIALALFALVNGALMVGWSLGLGIY
jgi:hypothetical protein